jgi:hypothetical protein
MASMSDSHRLAVCDFDAAAFKQSGEPCRLHDLEASATENICLTVNVTAFMLHMVLDPSEYLTEVGSCPNSTCEHVDHIIAAYILLVGTPTAGADALGANRFVKALRRLPWCCMGLCLQ